MDEERHDAAAAEFLFGEFGFTKGKLPFTAADGNIHELDFLDEGAREHFDELYANGVDEMVYGLAQWLVEQTNEQDPRWSAHMHNLGVLLWFMMEFARGDCDEATMQAVVVTFRQAEDAVED